MVYTGRSRGPFLAVPSENPVRRRSSGTTLVAMVQSPDLGESDDLSKLSLVRRSRIGRVLLEREVGAGAVLGLVLSAPAIIFRSSFPGVPCS